MKDAGLFISPASSLDFSGFNISERLTLLKPL